MTLDEPFDLDFRPSVPVSVRAELNKLLKGTTRIVVYEETAEGKTRKLNAVRLNTRPGAFPSEALEEIAETVTAIMHIAWDDQDVEDPEQGLPPMSFVVICEQGGKGRKRTQFKYTYRGEREPDFIEDTMSIEERSVHRVLEMQERAIDKLFAYIADSNDRLIRMVEQNTASSAAGSEVMRQAIPLFVGGMQSVLNAKSMEFSTARAEAQEKATTERITAALKTVGPFVGLGIQQFIRAKLGVELPMPGPESFDDDDSGDEQQQPEITDMLAAMAQSFGGSLTNQQRAELNKILTKKQVACFDAMFCAETDADAYAAYMQIVEHARDKLLPLQSLLDDEQNQVLGAFMQLAADYASKNNQ